MRLNMTKSYKDFLNDSLEIEKQSLKPKVKSLDLYTLFKENKTLEESVYTISIISLEESLPESLKFLLTLSKSLSKNMSVAKVLIQENGMLLTNMESLMFYNNNSKYKYSTGKQYRVQGLLMELTPELPLLGYSSRGVSIPPRFMGETNLDWSPDKVISPPFKIKGIPKPKSPEYYKDKYDLDLHEHPTIPKEKVDLFLENHDLTNTDILYQLSEYSIYPLIQVLCTSDVYRDTFKNTLDNLGITWGTFINPLEVSIYSKYPSARGKTWVRFVKCYGDLYLDLPTLNLYS